MNAMTPVLKLYSKDRAIAEYRIAAIQQNEAFLREYGQEGLADSTAACLEKTREILKLIDDLVALRIGPLPDYSNPRLSASDR
jgi:hypothetical protein